VSQPLRMAHTLLKSFVVAGALAWLIHGATATAQNSDVLAADPGPYRRVYVRDSDLPLEGYRAMDLKSFSAMLEDLKKRTESLDPNSPSNEIELRAFHAQVRLVGADLVSERSRLRWNWDASKERIRNASREQDTVRNQIAPWNAAIDAPSRLSGNPLPNSSTPPAWVYDSNGLPLIRVSSDEDWFSWTLRPLSNSTPNRLNFAPTFPRTVDSCLVLQLPKTARIVDANIVVRPASNWNEVTERIGDWPVALAASDNIPELNGTDSFWLLELSGRDQANFSILLNPSRGIYDNLSSDDRSLASWNRLIARQTTSHTVSLSQIKTLCEWEWYETTTLDRTFRIRVPEGMRLRNLKLNERETVPRFSDRVIELTVPSDEAPSNASSNNTTRIKVSAEFLSSKKDLSSDSDGIIKIPAIECLNGYVVSGTTSIAADGMVELRNIYGGNGRLETVRNSDKGLERLDFSWFQSSPEISFAAVERIAVDSAEILTRLSTDANRAVAFVKMQLSPWRESSPSRIRIGSGWSLETMQINHRGLGLSIEESNPVVPSASLRIDATGPVDDGPVQIELKLTRDIASALGDNSQAEGLVDLPDRKTRQALVIEPGYASQLEYYGDFYRDLCDEEMLTPWQRDRLPRLGRFLLFRMPEGRLPKLRPKEETPLIQCSIATRVSGHEDHVRVEHLFDLDPGSTIAPSVDIQLPGIWRWEWETPEGWKSFEIKAGANHETWTWTPPLPILADKKSETETSKPFRFRAVAKRDRKSEVWQLSVPRLSSDQPVSYSLQTDPFFQVMPDQPRGIWDFENNGQWIMRWQDPAPSSPVLAISIQEIDQGNRNRWWIAESHLHLAVDTLGHQRALLALDARGIRNDPWEFNVAVPDGWSIERIADETFVRSRRNEKTSFAVHREGNNYRIQRNPANANQESLAHGIRIVMSGPKLKPQSHREWGVLPTQSIDFSWPEIRLESPFPKPSRTLWTPTPIAVAGPLSQTLIWNDQTEASLPRTNGFWSAWQWTAEAASWLGWHTNRRNESTQNGAVRTLAETAPRELVPSWALTDWKPSHFAEQGSTRDNIPSQPLSLRYSPSRTGPALWLVIAVLLAYCLLPTAPWLCLMLAGLAAIGGHWLPDPIAIWFRSTWVGFAIGALVYLIRRTVTSPGLRPADRDRPEPWHPWNEPGLSNDGLSEPSGRAVVVSSIGLILSLAIGLPMLAQDPTATSQSNRNLPFDVLIPLNEEGTSSGDVVYVPSSIVMAEDALPPTSSVIDRDSYVISARHSLRFDARSISFGNTEQPCNHIYEVWIGESGVGRPWRIPFSSDRSRLSRFLIDGAEVASSRLAKSDSELAWYPERSGRRLVQIESQMRIRPSEREKNDSELGEGIGNEPRSPRAWGVDVPILPAGNAMLDIETDAGWSVDFNRRGRSSNPSIGKFSVQLGNQDRLVGEISPDAPSNIPGSVAANDPGTLGTTDAPQMNTELFIDRGQLLARTIVEYPRTVDAPEEIELESDLQWQPIGNLWGEAKLVDVRPGSTLDRRRYIIRWIPETASSSGKRVITTTWIPAGNANLRNVLFAECRDRRVRPNTLRYARSAGSMWMLEGINTWVPSINTKERIEWLELNERPIATSLRIPINGGFGVLRQQPDSKLQRARVTHQLGIGSAKISLRSRIEFANALNNRRSLVASIPSRYSVVEVLSRNTPLSYIEWVAANRRFIQVFADRETGDVSELVVMAEQDVSDVDTEQVTVPILSMEGASIAEQFAEISADPAWRIRIPEHAAQSQVEILRGRGLGKPLASMSLLDFDDSATIPLERLKGEWQGDLSARILSITENELRWELRMIDNPSLDAKPTLAISLPNEMSRDWKSEATIKELPSLSPARRWLQVQPIWGDDQRSASLAVEWVADPKALQDDQWIDRVRFESDPQLKCQLTSDKEREPPIERNETIAVSAKTRVDPSQTTREHLIGLEVHRVLPAESNATRISMFSSWWVNLRAEGDGDEPGLVWRLPPGVRVDWVSINGEGAYWRCEGEKLTVVLPPLGIPVRIDLWTDCDASLHTFLSDPSAINGDAIQKVIPALERNLESSRNGWLIGHGRICDLEGHPEGDHHELPREICRRNIEALDALNQMRPKSEGADSENEGMWHRWRDYLIRETQSILIARTEQGPTADEGEDNALVASYLVLVSQGNPKTPQFARAWNKTLGNSIDADLYQFSAQQPEDEVAHLVQAFAWDRLLATLSMGLLVVLAPWAWLTFGRPMQSKPWWPLVLIGAGIWLVTGTWIPGLVLTLLALILAIDSYLILNERFRQSGTRAPR
jgi:hypothetical protein